MSISRPRDLLIGVILPNTLCAAVASSVTTSAGLIGQLALIPLAARPDFRRVRLLVQSDLAARHELEVLHGIGNVNLLAVDSGFLECAVKHLSRSSVPLEAQEASYFAASARISSLRSSSMALQSFGFTNKNEVGDLGESIAGKSRLTLGLGRHLLEHIVNIQACHRF